MSEGDGEESWFEGANGDSEGYLKVGGRKRRFGVESKIFEIEVEKKKGRTFIFITESKGGVSSWIKLGPASLGPLIEGLVFCSKDMRTGHWEKRWQENGRFFSLERGENKEGCFLKLGVLDREKKRFNIFVPRGRGAKGGWSLLVEALREMESISGRQVRQKDKEIFWSPLRGKSFAEVVKQNHSIGEEVARVRVDNSALCVNLEKLAHCLVGCWNSTRGGGEDLRSWGTQMSKLWGLKGNLGLAKLEDGKALLEFGLLSEAEKALDMAEISVGGFVIRLEKWSPRSGCLMEEEKVREAWVRIVGLPISLWNRDILSKVGEACGGFLGMDAKTERMEELQWARIRVRRIEEKTPNMVEIWVGNMCYSLTLWWETRPTLSVSPTGGKGKSVVTEGEVEGEAHSREGKRVKEAKGGSRPEVQMQSADGTRRLTSGSGRPMECSRGPYGLQLKPQGTESVQSGQVGLGSLMRPCGTEGFNQSSSSVASLGPKENRRIEAWRPTVEAGLVAEKEPSDHLAVAQRCGPNHTGSPLSDMSLVWEKDGMRWLGEAELPPLERSKTDLALVEEASRYVMVQSDCLIPVLPSSPLSFFDRTPVGEYCDLSGLGEKRDEDENPLQMLMGMEPPVSEPVECWDLVEVGKDRIDVTGKGLDSDQIVPMGNKAGGELSWEKSDLAKFSKFLGFSTEGLEKDIMEFLVKIRKRRESVHNKTFLEKSKFERELKRLECSINYEKGEKQNGEVKVRGCQITEVNEAKNH